MVVFTVESLSCCNSIARPVKQYRHIMGLYSHVDFFFNTKQSHRFPVGDLRKNFVTSVADGLIILPKYCRNKK